MLYRPSTLVLFYKSFSTTYSYTKIGKVDEPAGLEAALGSDNVVVTFEGKRQKE
jgi:cyclophilin-like protein